MLLVAHAFFFFHGQVEFGGAWNTCHESPRTLRTLESPRTLRTLESPRTLRTLESPRTLRTLESPRAL